VPLTALASMLVVLLILSAFFSSSETGMMALNRYRLRHKARSGHKGAQRTSELLDRTDRLISIILIGNNFVNILASSISTIIALRLWGDAGIAVSTFTLTMVILIFGEITPKTLAALHPEKVAFPASLVLKPLLFILYPFVIIVNAVSNVILSTFGIDTEKKRSDQLNQEELRMAVHESGSLISSTRRGMLLGILDLEKATVEDIMIPRNEIIGINIQDGIKDIIIQLKQTQHTRLPVFKNNINNVVGILHLRKIGRLLHLNPINKPAILHETDEAYFIPAGIPLHTQLLNFQKNKRRNALVVDEYGDIMGLVTLEDILEEIVGDFTTDVTNNTREIIPQKDGSQIIDGTATIRDINKSLEWNLPINGPKTLNGLITEQLQEIPESNVCIIIDKHYRMEILRIKNNIIRSVRVYPPITRSKPNY